VQAGKIRVIGGKFKGRKVSVPKVDGVRPTTDRVRETLFNWLQPYIFNAHCLDAFAGTGILGIEAISRGAQRVTFVEQNKKVIQALKSSVELLGADNADLLSGDFFSAMSGLSKPFDLVFLDPPFETTLLSESLHYLQKKNLLNENAIIYCEQSRHSDFTLTDDFQQLKTKHYGEVAYSLWQKIS
jgi:16S rRNA (guanine966-N2)-methyltransferase